MTWLYFVLAAAAGALLVGLVGFGSSLVILPVLLLVFPTLFESEVAVRLALGTTMATMIVGAVSAGTAQARGGAVCWPLLKLMIVPYLVGAGLGPWVSAQLNVELLRIYIAAVLVLVALLTLRRRAESGGTRSWAQSRLQIAVVHTLIGAFSSVAGIASGIFAIPYLSRFELPLRTVIGTSTVAAALYSAFATISYVAAGWQVEGLPAGCLGYVYLPAFALMSVAGALFGVFGVRLGRYLSVQWLRGTLCLFLLVSAVAIAVR